MFFFFFENIFFLIYKFNFLYDINTVYKNSIFNLCIGGGFWKKCVMYNFFYLVLFYGNIILFGILYIFKI